MHVTTDCCLNSLLGFIREIHLQIINGKTGPDCERTHQQSCDGCECVPGANRFKLSYVQYLLSAKPFP